MTDKNNKNNETDSNSSKNNKKELIKLLLQLIKDNPKLFKLNVKLENICDKINTEYNTKSNIKHHKKEVVKDNNDNIKTIDTNTKGQPKTKDTNSKTSTNTKKNNHGYNALFGNYDEMINDIGNIPDRETRERFNETIDRVQEMENNMTPEERNRLELYRTELNRRVTAVDGFIQTSETLENIEKRLLILNAILSNGMDVSTLSLFRNINISQDQYALELNIHTINEMIRRGYLPEGTDRLMNMLLQADNETMELLGINGAINEIADNIIKNNKNNKDKQNKR